VTAVAGPGNLDAIVVGAGLAGLYQLYRLRELGLAVRVIEAADGVGGTWYWNRYPGARCDVQSLSYSYSFSPELEQEWEWTEKYPTQPEILRYLNHVADRFDLRRDITFGTTVVSARYDENAARWTVTTSSPRASSAGGSGGSPPLASSAGGSGGSSPLASTGGELTAQFLIMATGCLSASKLPEVPGLERYRGRLHHTARWGNDEVRFDGLRVGVIGTGSSGIQSIPIIAEQAADLTVFQRTPNFAVPAGNRPLTAAEIAETKANYPAFRAAQRASRAGIPATETTELALATPAPERTARYQANWDKGDLISLIGSYLDILIDPAANETAAEFVRAKIRSVVTDPDVAETLSPRSFPLGTKRLCLHTGYYETFNRPNVHLVDLRTTPLAEFTPAGLRTSAAEYEFDAIVLATGFDAMTGALNAIDIRGRDAVSLASRWAAGPRTYLGVAIAGFPNLFIITGPGSPSVLSNMAVSIEQHVEWISDCIRYLRSAGFDEIEATEAAEAEWVQHVADVGSLTLFPQANSWYMGANVPGKPRVFLPYIGGVATFREKCDEVAAGGYEGFAFGSASNASRAAPAVS
jgi:cation diffusion facilitator CzcD-associated flavoprotein CzcO